MSENYEIVLSQKRREKLIYKGNSFRFGRLNEKTKTMFWRCDVKTCHGKVTLCNGKISLTWNHNHKPNPAKIEALRACKQKREFELFGLKKVSIEK